ncbi:NAD(+)--dinitrogen-reductase ADP-D-ribosyltransferase [Geobacter sulfurreducens]|uniref:NAD(+)--dinitrogen-reductase ADP-D-ribosyltransferase n=1 Tax=Geobacter sulfurreducens TaxID=35554 RepID=UPI000DBAF846|nr:NAD(+)--dinitrogen-reductase ADP-D-ribosyltransferase [Geobacter sulfurreducens]BBA71223.1 NAD(+)--dinitrogen-reductase ADP-D-ribosyltransferase [Geobacter sulfurreducens]
MLSSGFNLCNLPPWVIASRHFNDNPHPLEVQGVRPANRFLFKKLDGIASAEERGTVFNDYMSVKFQLHHWQAQQTDTARKSLKNSYLRYLRGWMMDSNSVEGAVLKGWVESRMGIVPTFHKARIGGIQSESYYTYVMDRTAGSKRTNAINSQLDILYEFCQYELARRMAGERWITLYRGTFDAGDYDVVEELGKREKIVRFNNLVSFTSVEERAWEFGFTVWEIRAPLSKIFFFNDLLPNSIMKGEGEYLVIGGEYRVRQIMCTI